MPYAFPRTISNVLCTFKRFHNFIFHQSARWVYLGPGVKLPKWTLVCLPIHLLNDQLNVYKRCDFTRQICSHIYPNTHNPNHNHCLRLHSSDTSIVLISIYYPSHRLLEDSSLINMTLIKYIMLHIYEISSLH